MLRTVWNETAGWVRQESAAAMALVQAFIALGIAFGWWHWSAAQTGAVVGIVSALLAMFVRSQVTPIVRARPARSARPGRVSEPPSPAPSSGPGTGPFPGSPGGPLPGSRGTPSGPPGGPATLPPPGSPGGPSTLPPPGSPAGPEPWRYDPPRGPGA